MSCASLLSKRKEKQNLYKIRKLKELLVSKVSHNNLLVKEQLFGALSQASS